ncbi:class I adenylate-forming enzyme family protein [Streptomyces sp. FXJ1.172]|uniref:class I adenylate-forming enzyme family protein n=1 Tax=Streptomyces sp. FXJ1.172 TaxID=710705 RepID=UPI0007CF0862|nr:class I adenylate-forming enzyme family protein [Streptomyces sp. FXJ1.172]WEO94225.1 class I adenylate-forming enzyme family protein [Streptomyces sp. FXJ1.172]
MPDISALKLDDVPQPTAPLGILPAVAAEKYPDTPFLSDTPWRTYDRPVRTFAEFARAIDDYADRLWAGGIRRGDVVAVVQRNHIEVEAVMCALGKIGALPALLSCAMESGELLECFARLENPYLLVDLAGLSKVAEHRHALRQLTRNVLCLQETDEKWVVPLQERLAHSADPRDEDEWFVITHSSGTTGAPKMAAHSTRSLFGMVAPMIMIFRDQYSPQDLNAKHLSFVHARTCAGTLASLETAMPALAIADPDPANVKRLMLEHRPTSIETHPNVYIQWEPLAHDPERPFQHVERFISTFDAMHPRTVRTLLNASEHPRAHYFQAYGQTESGPICLRIVTRDESADYSPRNVGHTGGGMEIRIVDAHGVPQPANTPGFIETRSPGRMRGYVGGGPMPPEDSWWPMGDIGRLLDDGSLELLDRIVEHVDGVGSLLEAEDHLLEALPELVELVLVKDEDDSSVFAVACPRPGTTPDPQRFGAVAAEAGLPGLQVRFWEWEAMPVTGSYKVRRSVLRRMLAGRIHRTATARKEA